MGSKDNGKGILEYASEIFGEPFEENAVITEDRLSPAEFFADSDITDFTIPSDEQVKKLTTLTQLDDEEAYIVEAVKAWMNLPNTDISTSEGKIALGKQLMHHSFMQAMISFIKGNYYQVSSIVDELQVNYPALKEMEDPAEAVNALLALISYARTGSTESPVSYTHLTLPTIA